MLLAELSEVVYLSAHHLSSPLRWLRRTGRRHVILVGTGLILLSALLSSRHLWAQLISIILSIAYGVALVVWWRADSQTGPTMPADTSIVATEESPSSLWLWLEFVVLVLSAPLLWFPSLRPGLTAIALATLAAIWLVTSVLEKGSSWRASPYDLALLVLLLMLIIGADISAIPELTMPKLASLALGLGAFRLILRTRPDSGSLGTVLLFMSLLALAFSLVGLISGVQANKFTALGNWLKRMPRVMRDLPGAQHGKASLNQLGGTLLFVLPLSTSVLLAPWRKVSPAQRLFTLIVTVLLGTTLALTQSRAAWTGMIAALLCILALARPWGRMAVALILIIAAVWWLVWGRATLLPILQQALYAERGPETVLGTLSLSGRLRIAARAVAHIAEHPLLGSGLGTFRALDGDPTTVDSLFDMGTPHAHNVFLQVGFDLGLPGLIAYLALLMVAAHQAWEALRRGTGLKRALAIGGLAALVGYHVYGLFDAVALGAKPGVLWWALLGLLGILPTASGGSKESATAQTSLAQNQEPGQAESGQREGGSPTIPST